jgi:hypothetical protein
MGGLPSGDSHRNLEKDIVPFQCFGGKLERLLFGSVQMRIVVYPHYLYRTEL